MDWLINILIAILRPALGLIILAGLLLFWILKRKLLRENSLKLITYIFSGAIIFQSIFSTILNWWLWSQQGITQRFLPPYSSINYVLGYSWQHYWFESIVTIFTAIAVSFAISFLNKRFENCLFYDEEKYLAALGILAVGWPNCLIFLSLVLFLGVLFHLISLFFNKESERLSLLYFWLPCALLILLLGDIISKYIGINQFII